MSCSTRPSASLPQALNPHLLKCMSRGKLAEARGSGTPLQLVHPRVGEILVFFGLASYITDRPVYALCSREFDGAMSLCCKKAKRWVIRLHCLA